MKEQFMKYLFGTSLLILLSSIFMISCTGCGGVEVGDVDQNRIDEEVDKKPIDIIEDISLIINSGDEFNFQLFNQSTVDDSTRNVADKLIHFSKRFYPELSILKQPISFRMNARVPKMYVIDPNFDAIENHRILYFDKELVFIDSINFRQFVPKDYLFDYDIIDTTYQGFPVYSLNGVSKEQIEVKFPDIIWDGLSKWEPNIPYSAVINYDNGVVDLNNEVISYNLLINGQNGPIAAMSEIVILDTLGRKMDTFKLNGEQVFMSMLTDNGRYLVVLSGRAYPEEGGGVTKENLRIYDIYNHELIFKEYNTKVLNSTIWQKDNLFFATRSTSKNDIGESIDNFYFYNPAQRIILSKTMSIKEYSNKDHYLDSGVYEWRIPNELKYTWNEFDSYPFTIANN